MPVTVFGVTTALEKNRQAVASMREAGFEIACHGYRWIQYAEMPRDQEKEHIAAAIRVHTEVTGAPPRGWYTGRMSVNTRELLVEAGGFVYDADSFADDLPYWAKVSGKDHLVVPYTLDNNDVRYVNTHGFQAPSFSAYLTDAFDFLRREAGSTPRMMSIGLHTRLVGKPGRAADLERFLDKVVAAKDAWV
ncbi:polysaccharide deacetylase family protein, partial [Mesorhizobium sp. M7D.F.Ca.US.004.01.2.1]|uniref:polysaccharide deacetylase family protein n=1 Tax=Mesorhizobium sp. M7D.F.Ca.US.004.01.2.1 TaxID=2496738 RepID=UPI001FE08F19